jgi:hypothetical protein
MGFLVRVENREVNQKVMRVRMVGNMAGNVVFPTFPAAYATRLCVPAFLHCQAWLDKNG